MKNPEETHLHSRVENKLHVNIPLNELSLSFQNDMNTSSQDLVEQQFPAVAALDNEQKADLAYHLLQSIPIPDMNNVLRRLTSNTLSRNYLETLPQELVINILCYLNVTSLLELSLASRNWYTLCQDSVIWRYLFEAQGWKYDAIGMERYLSKESSTHYTIPSKQLVSSSPHSIQSTPIVRSSTPLYQRRIITTTNSQSGDPPITITPVSPIVVSSTSALSPTSISISSSKPTYSILKPFHGSSTKPRKPILSQKVASNRTLVAIAPHPGHQHLLPHYDVKTHTRFIDWKSLYRYRHKIAAAWRLGRYRPYRFRSDPASLRRQQLEENEEAIIDSGNTNDPEISMSTTISSSLSSSTLPPSTQILASVSEGSASDSSALQSQQQQQQHSELQYTNTMGSESSDQRRQQQQLRDQHQDAVYSLALDATRHTIFSASRDQTLKEWNFDHAVATLQHTYTDLHKGSILCLDVDDHYIVSGSKDRTIVQTDRWRRQKLRVLHGHQDSVLNVVLDKDWIYSASKDRTINIWSSSTGDLLRTLHGHREAVNAIKSHQNRIVSASGDRTIKLWHRDTGECLQTFLGHERAISCLDFDGTYIVSGSNDKSIIIWDITGKMVRKFYAHTGLVRTLQLQQPQDDNYVDHPPLPSQAVNITGQQEEATIPPTSRIIVSAGYNDNVNVWDFETGRLLHTFPRYYQGRIINLRFDNMKIVLGLDSGDIVVYDFAFGLDSRFLL